MGNWGVPELSPGIGPTVIETNLSYFPIDAYFSLNTDNNWSGTPGGPYSLISGCPQSITVQKCLEQIMDTGTNNWRSQGVTGVRFFFSIDGTSHGAPFPAALFPGWFSSPFNSDKSVNSTWRSNLHQFLVDLQTYGIIAITPTPAWPGSYCTPDTPTYCNRDGLEWNPLLPFGFDPLDGANPDRRYHNASYYDSPKTPDDIFWGWDTFFNLVDAILAEVPAGMDVNAFDYLNEVTLADFTVLARMIYDPHRAVDVLGTLRAKMAAHGFDPGRVSMSAADSSKPDLPSWDCGSVYGDSAMLINLSELTAAIAGPYSAIGLPDVQWNNNLPCSSSMKQDDLMISLPVYHTQPTFIDIHAHLAYSSSPDGSSTAIWAKNFFSDVWSFLVYRGLTASLAVFGETNRVWNPGCDQWSLQQASGAMNGILGLDNGYRHSTLYANHASSVVMRPWQETTGYKPDARCTLSPNIINPPYNRFGQ
jgi:hypothetical protein